MHQCIFRRRETMFEREISASLKSWKRDSGHKCLMVRGARQIGKTFSVTEFGKSHYDSFIGINFLEMPSVKKVFSQDLDTDTLVRNISLYLREAEFIPNRTLLFLDEIQECPEAITSLKFWNEDSRFDVVASGSMLGIDYKRPSSYPVGAVEYLDMHAMNFREFLMAVRISDDVMDLLKECFNRCEQVPWAVHDKMMEYVRLYMILGGMPQVLDRYFSENSIASADQKAREILNDYRYDIAHYAPAAEKIKAEKCYFSLAGQLSKENHKFQYALVEKSGTRRKFGSSMDWLVGAYLVTCVKNINEYTMPLSFHSDEGCFRVYPTDVGLLTAMYEYPLKGKLITNEPGNLNPFLKGGIYEALVADFLVKNGHKDIFFKKNESATFEIEFLIENTDGIIPIEVKAGKSRSRSLDNLLGRDDIPYGYKLGDTNVGKSGKKITMPIYMAMFL